MYGFLLLFNNLSVSRESNFFLIFDIKNAVTLKTGIRVREGHWKCHHSIERIWLPIGSQRRSTATMSLSRTVYEINGDFGRNSQIFLPVYFAPPLKGFPLKLGIGAGIQKLEWWGYRAEKELSLTISSAVWIEYTNMTDGRTDTRRQQRPRLRIASRGKNR